MYSITKKIRATLIGRRRVTTLNAARVEFSNPTRHEASRALVQRYCKDCRYFSASDSTCSHPKLQDLMTGLPRPAHLLRRQPAYFDPGACGDVGNYFERAALQVG